MKAALLGPPRSGKSCLREGLKEAIRQLDATASLYVITAQRDGEGAWFQETALRHPELALRLKRENKKDFSQECTDVAAAWVRNCQEPLTLIDAGGRADAKNEEICRGATHAILLCPAPEHFVAWRAFCSRIELPVLAEIVSDYLGNEDTVEPIGYDGILRAKVHRLERGEPVAARPAILALAERMVHLQKIGTRHG